MHLDDLRTILLAERDSGPLTTIPEDLYTKVAEEIRTLQQEVFILEDPFSDQARLLIEKVASIRTTIEELFKIRTDKVVNLAQSQAEGSFIDREELRVLIPSETVLFNNIVEAITNSQMQLIEWKAGHVKSIAKPPINPDQWCDEGETSASGSENRAETYEQISEQEEVTDSRISYAIVRALTDMEPFMGVDGRIYEVREGDILTLPMRNAEVLVERNIVLNIHPG